MGAHEEGPSADGEREVSNSCAIKEEQEIRRYLAATGQADRHGQENEECGPRRPPGALLVAGRSCEGLSWGGEIR